ncbi:MAG: ABC transporter ATP-binding protein [Pseudomonadota bacterium]
MPEALLSVDGLTAGYVPDMPILHEVHLTAPAGALTVVIGPNGAGKSTLIKAVAGLVPVAAGCVVFAGAPITGTRPDRLSTQGIAYVPQSDNVFKSLSIAQNLDLALRGARRAGNADALFARFPVLGEKRRERAASLSGGQRQLLAIAMALATEPRLVLMDEPSAGLSPKAADEVLDHARALADAGTAIVLVEQNVKQALRRGDRAWVLAEGRNRLDAPSKELLGAPDLGEIYLGLRAEDRADQRAGVEA